METNNQYLWKSPKKIDEKFRGREIRSVTGVPITNNNGDTVTMSDFCIRDSITALPVTKNEEEETCFVLKLETIQGQWYLEAPYKDINTEERNVPYSSETISKTLNDLCKENNFESKRYKTLLKSPTVDSQAFSSSISTPVIFQLANIAEVNKSNRFVLVPISSLRSFLRICDPKTEDTHSEGVQTEDSHSEGVQTEETIQLSLQTLDILLILLNQYKDKIKKDTEFDIKSVERILPNIKASSSQHEELNPRYTVAESNSRVTNSNTEGTPAEKVKRARTVREIALDGGVKKQEYYGKSANSIQCAVTRINQTTGKREVLIVPQDRPTYHTRKDLDNISHEIIAGVFEREDNIEKNIIKAVKKRVAAETTEEGGIAEESIEKSKYTPLLKKPVLLSPGSNEWSIFGTLELPKDYKEGKQKPDSDEKLGKPYWVELDPLDLYNGDLIGKMPKTTINTLRLTQNYYRELTRIEAEKQVEGEEPGA